MSSNNRILYSCQVPSIVAHGAGGSGIGGHTMGNLAPGMVHGVQSIGITTNFNLEQAFELGQIEIYENIEGTPDVEVTMEKFIDGYPLMYLLASTGVTGTDASGLVARSKERCDVVLGIFGEEFNNVASATPLGGDAEAEVYMSGMYISSISYNIPVDGTCTESITLVGNSKEWLTGDRTSMSDAAVNSFDGLDAPKALGTTGAFGPSGGLQRREDVLLEHSILPVGIQGVNGTGLGNAYRKTETTDRGNARFTASGLGVHVQSVSISTDFSREDVFELGRKTPYYRPANFPIEVSCEIEAITTSGDFITALENGDPTLFQTTASGNNTAEENIFFTLRGGITLDVGAKNRLASVSYGGADATGGNASCTYSYTNFNDLDVKQIGHNDSGVMGFLDTDASSYFRPSDSENEA
tara:strand:+ start:1806 stop:3041 length:1236 start_codon:yes stop_codon:yes gene_type:complete